MSTKLVLYTSKTLSTGESPIRVRIIQNRKVRYVPTGFNCYPHEWDGSQLKTEYKKRKKLTQDQFENINSAIWDKLNEVVDVKVKLQKGGKTLNTSELVKKVKKDNAMTFDEFTEQIIKELVVSGRIGNARAYKCMLSVLRDYNGKKQIRFEEINVNWLKNIESKHYSKGNVGNSLSTYFRSVRAVFNRAIAEKIIDLEQYPFGRGGYQIPSSPIQRRAVDKTVIQKIASLDLPENSSIWHTRNYFMFSFYMRGLNFIDISELCIKNIVNGRLEYVRQKTKRKNSKTFSIAIIPQAMEILKYYIDGKESDDRIFPIITKNGTPEQLWDDYSQQRKTYNKYLKKIAEMVGVPKITSYTTRHSWATIGKRAGIEVAHISDGLGHADMKTTQAYLDSIENTDLDKTNELIIASVMELQKKVSESKKKRAYRRFNL